MSTSVQRTWYIRNFNVIFCFIKMQHKTPDIHKSDPNSLYTMFGIQIRPYKQI